MRRPGERIGVLLVNLGTPDRTDYLSVRRYLKEFLWDPRVVETNRALWWVLLHGVILTLRPTKSGRAYRKIWNAANDESPLRTITRAQAAGLASKFSPSEPVTVEWAMRYGEPSIASRIARLKDDGHDRILIAPLYPQYSATTTATVVDKVGEALRAMRWQPAIRTLPAYYDHPAYIAAIAESVRRHLAGLSWKPEKILASFHGLPRTYVEKGDPYYGHCRETARLISEALGLGGERFSVMFQSRFGRAEWLKPYAVDTIIELARAGVRNIVVVCPGFAADCVETLEEVALGLSETFADHGGKNFSLVPALNDSPGSIDMLDRLIRQELQGWLT
jgi:ferrochelatase